MQTFVDCDGVIAYFNKNVVNFFNQHPAELKTEDMWQLINAESGFWPAMPVKDGAERLWAALAPYNQIVITGCPKDNYDAAAAHKVDWVKQHFGQNVRVITCLAKDKQNFMTAPGDILIDDFKSNIKRWIKAGGRGIWFHDADQAIADFKAMVEENV